MIDLVDVPMHDSGDSAGRYFRHVRSGVVYDGAELRTSPIATRFGEMGSLGFLINLSRAVDVGQVWCPTWAESRAVFDQRMADEEQARVRRAVGAPPVSAGYR